MLIDCCAQVLSHFAAWKVINIKRWKQFFFRGNCVMNCKKIVQSYIDLKWNLNERNRLVNNSNKKRRTKNPANGGTNRLLNALFYRFIAYIRFWYRVWCWTKIGVTIYDFLYDSFILIDCNFYFVFRFNSRVIIPFRMQKLF